MVGLVLLSGGLDSTVLTYLVRDQVEAAIGFDYGQKHVKELDYASRIARNLELLYKIVRIKRGIKTDIEIPKGLSPTHPLQKQTVFPNRNAIFLNIAIGYAMSYGFDKIFVAAHKDDWAIYPDCRPEFFDFMNDFIRLIEGTCKIVTPFLYLNKVDIVKIGITHNVPLNETWTCYEGGEEPCGQCAACIERNMAIKEVMKR